MFLITGTTGLLGGHLLYALLRKHDRVAALRRPSSNLETLREIFTYYTPDPDALLERIDWRSGDMLDPEGLAGALEGISCVINCAAIVSFDPRDRNLLIRNNVEGVKNLAEAMRSHPPPDGRPVAALVHISSTSALGDGPGDDPGFRIDETTSRDSGRRHSGYSVSKYESEQVLQQSGIQVVTLNPGIILGPGQWGKGSSQLFVKAWQGLRFYPYGGTGYVDVRDLAEIIVTICDRMSTIPLFGERFCVVGANLRYRDFFNRVTDEFGKPNPDIFAGRILSGLAWRADTISSRLTGRHPLLTRETAESARRISFYSADKVMKALAFGFRPIEETIEWVASLYKIVADRINSGKD